jgi:hypothetical protein
LVGAGFIPARKEPIVPPIPALEPFNLGKRTLDAEKDNNFNPTVQVGIQALPGYFTKQFPNTPIIVKKMAGPASHILYWTRLFPALCQIKLAEI